MASKGLKLLATLANCCVDGPLCFVLLQGVVVTGVTYWLQLWVVEKKGPLFVAAFTPLALIITAIISMFLWKEILHWGRYILFFVIFLNNLQS